MRTEGAKDANEFLEKFGADALRAFIEQRIAKAFPDFESESAATPAAEDFVIEDVFDAKDESGQRVIDYLFEAAKKHPTDRLLLGMPTVRAYQAGKELVAGVGKHSKGELTDAGLMALTDRFINAHLRSSDDVLGEWTGKDVPLFCLTLKTNGARADVLTCNLIQSWIVREFWCREYIESEIDIVSL